MAVFVHFVGSSAISLFTWGSSLLTLWHSLLPLCVNMGSQWLTLWQSLLSLCVNAGSRSSLCGSPCSLSVSIWDPTAHFVALTALSLCQCRILMTHFVAVRAHFLAISALSLCQCGIPRLTLWQYLLTFWQSLLPLCVNAGSHGSLCGSHCSLSVSMQDPNSSLCGSPCSLSVSMRDPTAHFVAVPALCVNAGS